MVNRCTFSISDGEVLKLSILIFRRVKIPATLPKIPMEFSVYNVITSPKEIVIMEEAEHYVYPEHWSQALQWIYSKQGM